MIFRTSNGLTLTRVGDECQTTSGGTPARKVTAFYSGGIPWVKSGELNDSTVTQCEETLTQEGLDGSAAKVFPTGTLLIALYGATVGKLGIQGMPSATNQAVCAIFPSERVFTPFLFYYLLFQRKHLIGRRTGGAQPNISQDVIRDLRLPLPSLREQQRIARLLEQADRLRRTRRYALELSNSFISAAFLELFGDRCRNGPFDLLGDLVEITGGGTPSRDRPEFFQGRIPWLTSKDMRGDYIWDTEEHITEAAIENSATNLVPAGSILVVVKSKVLMHRLPVAIAKVPMCHGQDIKSIQCSKALHHEFARFVLKHHEQRLLNIARGANTEGLTLPMLEELPVPKVDWTHQQEFASLVERHERLRAVQREALRQAEHLFQSLLHRAFTANI